MWDRDLSVDCNDTFRHKSCDVGAREDTELKICRNGCINNTQRGATRGSYYFSVTFWALLRMGFWIPGPTKTIAHSCLISMFIHSAWSYKCLQPEAQQYSISSFSCFIEFCCIFLMNFRKEECILNHDCILRMKHLARYRHTLGWWWCQGSDFSLPVRMKIKTNC